MNDNLKHQELLLSLCAISPTWAKKLEESNRWISFTIINYYNLINKQRY